MFCSCSSRRSKRQKLQTKNVHNRLENKEQKRRKKKNERKSGVVGDTTFITWKREASMSLTIFRH